MYIQMYRTSLRIRLSHRLSRVIYLIFIQMKNPEHIYNNVCIQLTCGVNCYNIQYRKQRVGIIYLVVVVLIPFVRRPTHLKYLRCS